MERECPVCGSTKVTESTGTEVFEYKGSRIPVEKYTLYKCEVCGEAVADPESRSRGVAIIRDAQRKIDGFLTSQEMRAIRKSFGMTQDRFGDLLGGGEKAFARYEKGRVMQSLAMDNLLRVLRDYPAAIETVRNRGKEGKVETIEKIGGTGWYEPSNVIEFPRIKSPYRMGKVA
jgi:HTH-type transcriptional regulator / antitoxin MqsA